MSEFPNKRQLATIRKLLQKMQLDVAHVVCNDTVVYKLRTLRTKKLPGTGTMMEAVEQGLLKALPADWDIRRDGDAWPGESALRAIRANCTKELALTECRLRADSLRGAFMLPHFIVSRGEWLDAAARAWDEAAVESVQSA